VFRDAAEQMTFILQIFAFLSVFFLVCTANEISDFSFSYFMALLQNETENVNDVMVLCAFFAFLFSHFSIAKYFAST